MYTVSTLIAWYREFAPDLRVAREEQRELLAQRPLRPRLDDLEAEIAYLTVRALRPRAVLELGGDRGWSTTWLLRALRDSDFGELYSPHADDRAVSLVPPELARTRWHVTTVADPDFVLTFDGYPGPLRPGLPVAARRGLPASALVIDPDLRDHLLSVKRRLRISAPVHRGRPSGLRFFAHA
jgi:hypothetical protein